MNKILFLLLIISLTGLTQIFADHHKNKESRLYKLKIGLFIFG